MWIAPSRLHFRLVFYGIEFRKFRNIGRLLRSSPESGVNSALTFRCAIIYGEHVAAGSRSSTSLMRRVTRLINLMRRNLPSNPKCAFLTCAAPEDEDGRGQKNYKILSRSIFAYFVILTARCVRFFVSFSPPGQVAFYPDIIQQHNTRKSFFLESTKFISRLIYHSDILGGRREKKVFCVVRPREKLP